MRQCLEPWWHLCPVGAGPRCRVQRAGHDQLRSWRDPDHCRLHRVLQHHRRGAADPHHSAGASRRDGVGRADGTHRLPSLAGRQSDLTPHHQLRGERHPADAVPESHFRAAATGTDPCGPHRRLQCGAVSYRRHPEPVDMRDLRHGGIPDAVPEAHHAGYRHPGGGSRFSDHAADGPACQPRDPSQLSRFPACSPAFPACCGLRNVARWIR
jgi:hypothetical protein